MKYWKAAGRLMHFASLDASGSRVPVYTVGWRIEDEPNDVWTQRFLGFKRDDHLYFIGGAFVLREAAKELLDLSGWAAEAVALTTALSSGKEAADKNSVLFRTGKWIAGHLGMAWTPGLFTKARLRTSQSPPRLRT